MTDEANIGIGVIERLLQRYFIGGGRRPRPVKALKLVFTTVISACTHIIKGHVIYYCITTSRTSQRLQAYNVDNMTDMQNDIQNVNDINNNINRR